jgi:hypothetical protein
MDGISPCIVQSVLLTYNTYAVCLVWCMQCIDLFLRHIYGLKTESIRSHRIYLCISFSLPLIPILVIGLSGFLGYQGNSSWCTSITKSHLTPRPVLLSFFIPGIVMILIGTVCVLCVLAMYMQTWPRTIMRSPTISPQEHSSIVPRNIKLPPFSTFRTLYGIVSKAAGPAVLLNITFLVCWLSVLHPTFELLAAGSETVRLSYDTWVTCMFEQLKQTSDASNLSWQSICGETPYSSFQGSSDSVKMFHDFKVLAISGQSILIALSFLPSKLSWYFRGDPNQRRDQAWRARLRSLSLRHKRGTPLISPEQPHRPPSQSNEENNDNNHDACEGDRACDGNEGALHSNSNVIRPPERENNEIRQDEQVVVVVDEKIPLREYNESLRPPSDSSSILSPLELGVARAAPLIVSPRGVRFNL